eukprot:gnl/TRDRNA2_/TRDRNA2_175767_c0_seq1.p1 gnl/TRDRNA2_/TRDRNA2_175767_c0~~gnl/TRDRNA2_/TRDRNA2_175767_c0_seq1.p1  ORF type:complete len:457 (-),score=93.63 gnl/TRDRNA2_/TRDRNA2_175767_c0_seq1:166-1536(-)
MGCTNNKFANSHGQHGVPNASAAEYVPKTGHMQKYDYEGDLRKDANAAAGSTLLERVADSSSFANFQAAMIDAKQQQEREEAEKERQKKELQEIEDEGARLEASKIMHTIPTMTVEQLLISMAKYIASMPWQEEASTQLRASFSNREGELRQIVALDGIEIVLQAMDRYVESTVVQDNSGWVISQLSAQPENVRRVVLSKGIRTTVSSMEAHISNPAVQEYGAIIFQNLAMDNRENKVSIGQVGGIQACIKAMKTHPDVATLQEKAAGALRVLAANPYNQGTIASCRGIAVILKAMRSHPTSATLQDHCCWALRNLAYNNKEMQDALVKNDGAELVIQALQTHGHNPNVGEHGCWALANISAGNTKTQERIVQMEGAQLVMNVMATHITLDKVQEQGCWALRNFAADHPTNRSLIVSLKGIDTAQKAREAHPLATHVERASREAIRVLEQPLDQRL